VFIRVSKVSLRISTDSRETYQRVRSRRVLQRFRKNMATLDSGMIRKSEATERKTFLSFTFLLRNFSKESFFSLPFFLWVSALLEHTSEAKPIVLELLPE